MNSIDGMNDNSRDVEFENYLSALMRFDQCKKFFFELCAKGDDCVYTTNGNNGGANEA